jgi:hypothetical protein
MLSLHDTEVLRRSGFIIDEIRELNNWLAPDGSPQHIDLSTPGWQGAIKARAKVFHNQMKGGKKYPAYEKWIRDIYQKLKDTGEQDDTIATFLRAEYSRIKVPKTDYTAARENRAMDIVNKAMYSKMRG